MAVIRLEDLPAFEIYWITPSEETELLGVFSHLASVLPVQSWLYAGEDSVLGKLVELDPETRRGKFTTSWWTPESPIQVGAAVPWFDWYWDLSDITMIVDPDAAWHLLTLEPAAAQHFIESGAHGWTRADMPLREGQEPTFVEPGGWDHEHCKLCGARIGVGGEPEAYVDAGGHWLCVTCYENFAGPRNLGFLLGQTSTSS